MDYASKLSKLKELRQNIKEFNEEIEMNQKKLQMPLIKPANRRQTELNIELLKRKRQDKVDSYNSIYRNIISENEEDIATAKMFSFVCKSVSVGFLLATVGALVFKFSPLITFSTACVSISNTLFAVMEGSRAKNLEKDNESIEAEFGNENA